MPGFSGRLSDESLAQVLSRILSGGRSGGLKVSRGSQMRQLFIESGTVIRYAASTLPAESLTEHLKQRGQFHADQMRRATSAKQAGELLSSTLLRLGFLGPEDHRALVREMIEKVVAGAAQWTDAAYEYQEGELPFTRPGDAGFPVPAAILGLVRTATAPAFLHAVLGDGGSRVHLNPAPAVPLDQVPLQPAEGFLVSRADGTLSLREITVMSPLPPDETDRALCALILAGFLKVATVEGEPGVPRTPPVSASDSDAGKAAPRPSKAPAPTPARKPAGPVEEMLERFSALDGQNLYQVLGLTPAVSELEVRHAYYSLAKKLHPDKFSEDETKNRAEKLFAAITEAYATLSRVESRGEYDKTLSQGSEKPSAESAAASAAAMARQNFLHGRALYEKQEMVKALTFFEHAVEQDGGKEEYHRYLALVQSRNPRLRKESERHFLRAIELNPTRAENYAQLGLLYRKMGLEEQGAEYLLKALAWDPGNETALAAMGSDPGKKGIFKGLFGK